VSSRSATVSARSADSPVVVVDWCSRALVVVVDRRFSGPTRDRSANDRAQQQPENGAPLPVDRDPFQIVEQAPGNRQWSKWHTAIIRSRAIAGFAERIVRSEVWRDDVRTTRHVNRDKSVKERCLD
jgi:hypothetical protein